MFERILIANRGEIACRIMRTAKRLGIASIAVYSEADRHALHTRMADEAYYLGPAPAQESYLNIDNIINAATRAKAEAIHPGYGFLSENAEFAERCAAAGLHFIGPHAEAIRIMGSKSRAKAAMEKARVPIVPGYHGDDQDESSLINAAKEIGYPLLVKASAGGGGKGMRVVNKEAELLPALQAAKREAEKSFGDGTLLLEKFIANARHVEVQIVADQHDNAVHLFERECSLQRRKQKVIEESPAPNVNLMVRNMMHMDAIEAALAIKYVGAGTIEFLYDPNAEQYYFMEMNTRLQVEHPVTEMITDIDLVEWQFRIAAGEKLPKVQSEITQQGHSFEARLYAEDPQKDFLPSTGKVLYFDHPANSEYTRIDSGISYPDEVSIYYDPMLAKIITWDLDRDTALRRLTHTIRQTHIAGVTTNRDFLLSLAQFETVKLGQQTIHTIEEHLDELLEHHETIEEEFYLVATLYQLLAQQQAIENSKYRSEDSYSPWSIADSWRMNLPGQQVFRYSDETERSIEVTVATLANGYKMRLKQKTYNINGQLIDRQQLFAAIDGQQQSYHVFSHERTIHIITLDAQYILQSLDLQKHNHSSEHMDNQLIAPMPGNVIAVQVATGQHVDAGTPLLILEAMKMEHTIAAPYAGTIQEIHFQVGDQVKEGVELVKLEADE